MKPESGQRVLAHRLACAVFAILSLGNAQGGHAQTPTPPSAQRFPADTRAGFLEPGVFPQALLDGQRVVLAPGARFTDRRGDPVLPQAVQGRVPVRYRLDSLGQIDRVWVLSPEEAIAAGLPNWQTGGKP